MLLWSKSSCEGVGGGGVLDQYMDIGKSLSV